MKHVGNVGQSLYILWQNAVCPFCLVVVLLLLIIIIINIIIIIIINAVMFIACKFCSLKMQRLLGSGVSVRLAFISKIKLHVFTFKNKVSVKLILK